MDGSRRFCTRCGNPLDPPDRFCGRCGAAVVGREPEPVVVGREPEPVDTDDVDDPLAEWERHRFLTSLPERRPDEAPTESIPAARPGDTGLLPQLPPAEVTAPPAPVQPVAEPPVPKRGFPLGATVALVGALAIILSAILPWLDPALRPIGDSIEPAELPVRILIDRSPPAGGPSLGLTLLLVGMVGALVALMTMVAPFLRFLRRLLGLMALALPGAFTAQVALALLEDGQIARTVDALGPGVYLAAGGALVLLVAGRWFRR